MSEREPPPLFDLPLVPERPRRESAERAPGAARRPEPPARERGMPLFDDEPADPFAAGDPGAESGGGDDDSFPFDLSPLDDLDPEPPRAAPAARPHPADDEPETAVARERSEPRPAPLSMRLFAALLDGGVLLAVAAVAVVGAYLLGVRWGLGDLAPLALFVALFSLLYAAVPLAFWGRTPGMALARLSARDASGGPLTFGQTALRWLGGLLTLALAGLPLLLALGPLGGRSLADRLSGSRCWLDEE